MHAKYNIYHRKNPMIPGQIGILCVANSMKDN